MVFLLGQTSHWLPMRWFHGWSHDDRQITHGEGLEGRGVGMTREEMDALLIEQGWEATEEDGKPYYKDPVAHIEEGGYYHHLHRWQIAVGIAIRRQAARERRELRKAGWKCRIDCWYRATMRSGKWKPTKYYSREEAIKLERGNNE